VRRPGGGVGGRGGRLGGLGDGSDPSSGRGSNGRTWPGRSIDSSGGVDGLSRPRDLSGDSGLGERFVSMFPNEGLYLDRLQKDFSLNLTKYNNVSNNVSVMNWGEHQNKGTW